MYYNNNYTQQSTTAIIVGSANQKRRHICNVVSHWLNPYTVISMLRLYSLPSTYSMKPTNFHPYKQLPPNTKQLGWKTRSLYKCSMRIFCREHAYWVCFLLANTCFPDGENVFVFHLIIYHILTLYVLFFQREHKHIFTFYVIPPLIKHR